MSLMPIFSSFEATAYRLDNAVSDGVSFDPLSGTALSNFGVKSLTWKPDGTRFFIPDGGASSSGDIYFYDCSTSWDLSSATYAGFFDLGGNLDFNDAEFNGDGTKLIARTDNSAYTYTLSTAYGGSVIGIDIDSVGRESEGGFFFNADGSAVYYRNFQGQNLYTRALSTAYDISSKVAESEITTTFSAGDMTVARGGTRVIIAGSNAVKEYSGDAYDFANFTLLETYAVTNVNFARYSGNGRKMHASVSSSTISQFSTAG